MPGSAALSKIEDPLHRRHDAAYPIFAEVGAPAGGFPRCDCEEDCGDKLLGQMLFQLYVDVTPGQVDHLHPMRN